MLKSVLGLAINGDKVILEDGGYAAFLRIGGGLPYLQYIVNDVPSVSIWPDGMRNAIGHKAIHNNDVGARLYGLLRTFEINSDKISIDDVASLDGGTNFRLAVFENSSNYLKGITIIPQSFISDLIARAEVNFVWGAGGTDHDLVDSGVYTLTDNAETHIAKLPLVTGNSKKKFTLVNQGTSGSKITLNTNLGGSQIYHKGSLLSTIDIAIGETLVIFNNTLNWTITSIY